MSYATRLQLALDHSKLSRVAFAESIGISAQAVSQVLNGQTKSLSAENSAKAAKELGVDHYWLATGDGSMSSCYSATAMRAAQLIDSIESVQIQHYLVSVIANVIAIAEIQQNSQEEP